MTRFAAPWRRRLSSRPAPWLLAGALLAPPLAAQEPPAPPHKFDPPRIVAVLRAPDTGLPGEQPTAYCINKGQESNLKRGDELNVYREVSLGGATERPMRILVGTLVITEAQTGSSTGRFAPSVGLQQSVVRYRSAMKGDIVVPRLIIDSGVLFDAGKADLKAGVAQEFEKVATFVQTFSPSRIIIEGHTDSDGDDESNQLLSDSRAETVRQYLINAYDFIMPNMIEARGYGERQPIVNNDTPENKALNRRIEVVVWE